MALTLDGLTRLLTTRFGGVLKSGKHDQDGEACVRELRSCALKLPWSDAPDGGSATDKVCQAMNDGSWSSNDVRTEHCLQLALLTESDASEGWIDEYVDQVIREILPLALEKGALILPATHTTEGDAFCTAEGIAAASASSAAARAIWAAIAASKTAWEVGVATRNALVAARYTNGARRARRGWNRKANKAASAASDKVLARAVQLLVGCHTGTIKRRTT